MRDVLEAGRRIRKAYRICVLMGLLALHDELDLLRAVHRLYQVFCLLLSEVHVILNTDFRMRHAKKACAEQTPYQQHFPKPVVQRFRIEAIEVLLFTSSDELQLRKVLKFFSYATKV